MQIRFFLKLISLLLVLTLTACSPSYELYSGEYELVHSYDKNSLDSVEIEEVINFSCGPCYRMFKNTLPELKSKYGDKLQMKLLPVVFTEQPDYANRLYAIANSLGKENEASSEIFRFKYELEQDIFDRNVVLKIAESLKISDEYIESEKAKWVEDILTSNQFKLKLYSVRGTPAVIINKRVKIEASSIENITAVLDSLFRI